MGALARSAERTWGASEFELAREGQSYTVETVALIRKQRPGVDIVLIVGSDNLPMIADWREPERLLELCTVAVVDRPGSGPAPAVTLPAERVHRGEGTALPTPPRHPRQRGPPRRGVRPPRPGGGAGPL